MLAYTFYESDTRVMHYATALARRGEQVDVFALRSPGTPAFEVMNGVNVHRIQRRTLDERGRLSYAFRILRFLARSTFILARRHLTRPYHVIHVHSVPDFLVFAALVPKLLGAHVILDIHDLLPEFYASKFGVAPDSLQFALLLLAEKLSARCADHVIIANDLWKERITSRSVPANKCTAICNYPDLDIFHRRPECTSKDRFVILYPGTLNAHQGLDVALRSFAAVADQMSNAEFHIYGEGPAKEELMTLAKQLGLDGRVSFHEGVPATEIARVMASSDLAVVPKKASSQFGNEAASTKIREFMAVGVPVIVSRTKVDTYYFDDSVVRFFESENVEDLADAILTLYREPWLRKTLVANAARHIQENNWGVKKASYLSLIDRLTSQGPMANN